MTTHKKARKVIKAWAVKNLIDRKAFTVYRLKKLAKYYAGFGGVVKMEFNVLEGKRRPS